MNQARVEAIERALILASNLVEGEIEYSWVARPGPVSTMRVYRCPECHLVGARPLLIVHDEGCEIGGAIGIIRAASDALKAECDESEQRACAA